MAHSEKHIKRRKNPSAKGVRTEIDSDAFYNKHPSWGFSSIDTEMWQFDKQHAGMYFWGEIFPFFKNLGSMEWREILANDDNSNSHYVEPDSLNPKAKRRLEDRQIEAESIMSLRINGTHRLYGYMTGAVFNILWFDTNHGDNPDCVCRSHKKHT